MPLYEFECDRGHVIERRESMDTVLIACKCGLPAQRRAVYRDQFISCETGPKGGMKVEPPASEKDLRKPFREFHEASQELDYQYSRSDDPKIVRKDLYRAGLEKAKKRGAKLRA